MIDSMSGEDNRYCIALQPIFDGEFSHVADELLYRAHGGAEKADITDPLTATARACSAAFYEIGLQSLVGERRLFLNVSRDWLENPDLMPLPPQQVVIELPTRLQVDEVVLACLDALRQAGYTLAADDVLLEAEPELLKQRVQMVKVDVRRADAFKCLDHYRQQQLTLLAEFIETPELLERCRVAGFDLYQGYVYAFPEQILPPSSGRSTNRSADLRLLRELCRPEPALPLIESLLAQDPHLCTLLFKRVNSASAKRVAQVTQLQQAIMMLGYDRVRALTATLLLADNQPVKRPLVFRALVRAELARRLAHRVQEMSPDTAFTLGLFSLMDQIEGIAMDKLTEDLGFDGELAEALLYQAGDLGKILKVIDSFERARLDRRSLKLVETLNREYLGSVAWAQEIMSIED